MNKQNWRRTVDLTSVAWFAMFFVGLTAFDYKLIGLDDAFFDFPSNLKTTWHMLSWIVWSIFVVDLFFKYRSSDDWKSFLRQYWFDIFLLVPFFRLFRVFRLLRILKGIKFLRLGKMLIKALKKFKYFLNRQK